jgi:carbon monoxide dehydrogenase subunit G
MILDGEFTFRAPRRSVWVLLQDPDVLVKAMPGAQRLVQTGDGTYEGHIRIGVGPVTAASWTLTVALHDREEPASYGMKVESKGPLGFTRGSASVELLDEPAGTRMKYRADMQIGGKVAGIGQRLLDQVARMLTRQGLEALSREMEMRLSLAVGSASASLGLATAPTVDGELVADDGAATASSGDDAAEANPESGDPAHAHDVTASANEAVATEDAMEPGEDAATPGAPLAPGVPEHAEPVADLDQELPPGTI